MANTATVIVITAGTITFGNEWYQTKRLDWKVPLATILLAAGMDAVAKLDSKGATLLSLMIFVGAVTTKFNGKSVIDTIQDLNSGKTVTPAKATVKK